MQLYAYRNTEAGAQPVSLQPIERRVNIVELKRMRAETDARERERITHLRENIIAGQRALANDAIRKANAALRRYNSTGRGLEQIAFSICRVFKITRAELLSDRRNKRVVFARQAVMYWAFRLSKLSSPEIGRRLGDRDHTTVLHGKSAYPVKRAAMGRHLREVH